ncbi:DNA/RNA helicase domain-containing protein [Flavobacterium sp. JP2137]|uniref:DNA/RNA helicase domain-containing protein n=1 Tax=Flavobacterium sp. JP2137 TaxID=3414510 RepID=UPI003D300AD3
MIRDFRISQAQFDQTVLTELQLQNPEYLSWPLVYVLSDAKTKQAYIGETTDVVSRMKSHLNNSHKQKLSNAHFILSSYFNKSAALDIESNLIKYVAADGFFQTINGNLGIANHQYYQKKEVYWHLFRSIWEELRSLGIARYSLEHIDNSDLFKYSPYKSLSIEQLHGLKKILQCLLDDDAKVSLIEGGAGTGKSILAIFLFKLLKTDLSDFNYSDFDETDVELFELLERVKEQYKDLKMALVIPMSSFRKTISNVFKNIKGLSGNMVIGPADMVKEKYDLLIIDESHRLRRRVNLGAYFGNFDLNCKALGLDKDTSSELQWALVQSDKTILFYDEKQSIKPSDVLQSDFIKLKGASSTRREQLTQQFRVKGGRQYVSFINRLLDQQLKHEEKYICSEYEVLIYDSLQLMFSDIKNKESQFGLSRMVAGFAWDWISKKDKTKFDIVEGDAQLQWNSTATDWVNSKNAINEVGCIHTIQGYDLNYIGVIIGSEIGFNNETNRIVIKKENYKDKNGKNSIVDSDVLHNYIINIYKTILLRGIRGTYIYVCDPDLSAYFKTYLPTKEVKTSFFESRELVIHDTAINNRCIPFYDLRVSAGNFSNYQTVEELRYIEANGVNQPISDLFACRVIGESMNKVIPNDSIVIFKKYTGGSRNGLICLVESTEIQDNELGGHYTIKEYESKKTVGEDYWHHSEIILKPLSTIHSYQPIRLIDEQTTDFKVLGVFVRVL